MRTAHRRKTLRGVLGAACIATASATAVYLVACYDFAYTAPTPDGGAPDDAFVPPNDAGADAADTGPSDPCASNRGPAMIMVPAPRGLGTFCIDATEVTRAQYAAFLAANPSATAANQIAACGWNHSFKPSKDWPDGGTQTGEYPVAYVDWCDAYAFCKWADKRLCGDVRGGAHSPDSLREDPSQDTDQWRLACTHAEDGQHAYPYGNDYEPKVCNGQEVDASRGHAVAVGSRKGCVGGFPGIYDMSGNLNELEDSCFLGGGDAAADDCWCRGGSFGYSPDGIKCLGDSDVHSVPRDFQADDLDFRCCR